jgi:hypothetical protein
MSSLYSVSLEVKLESGLPGRKPSITTGPPRDIGSAIDDWV